MRKVFTRKPQVNEPATYGKNYITPSGLQRLKDEHRFLLTRERPAVVEVVRGLPATAIAVKTPIISSASGRLRQIDGWVRFLYESNRSRGSSDPGSFKSGAGKDKGILRSDRALCQAQSEW